MTSAAQGAVRWQPRGPVALGGGPFGNLFSAVGDDDVEAAILRAWERGVRCFDTAPHYGLGLSERRLGRVLATLPRGELEISTKVGRLLVPDPSASSDDEGFAVAAGLRRQWDFSASGVRRSLAESLDRLGLDRVDVVYLHDPDDHLDEAADVAFPALARLRDEGAVAAVGVGTNDVDVALALVRRCPIDVVMIAGRLSLLDQSAAVELLPTCLEHGIAVVVAGVFNSGVLAQATPDAHSRYEYRTIPSAVLARVMRIADVCAAHRCSLRAAALAFPRRHGAVSAVCFGARDAAEVASNLDAFDQPVDPELWSDLASRGLLDRALVP